MIGDGNYDEFEPIETHHVPTVTIIRPVLQTKEVRDFHAGLTEEFKRPRYKERYAIRELGRWGITLASGERIRAAHKKVGIVPDEQLMADAAKMVCAGLKESLDLIPRTIDFSPAEQLGVFGKREKQFGYSSSGWKGYKAYSPGHKVDGSLRPNINHRINEEHNTITGVINNVLGSGIDSHSNYRSDVQFGNICSNPPHLALGSKQRGNRLAPDEIINLNGIIDEIYAESIGNGNTVPVFDPIVHLGIGRNKQESEAIATRYNLGTVTTHEFMTVRRVARSDYDGLLSSDYFVDCNSTT